MNKATLVDFGDPNRFGYGFETEQDNIMRAFLTKEQAQQLVDEHNKRELEKESKPKMESFLHRLLRLIYYTN